MKHSTLLASALLALTIQSPLANAGNNLEPAPQFTAKRLNGETFDLSSYKGDKPVLLKFWATWCSYCLEEMPHLDATYDKYRGKLEVLTINVGFNDSVRNVQTLFDEKGYKLPTVFDADGSLTSQYKVIGTPTQVLIDRDGMVRMRTHLTTDSLEAAIDAVTQGS
ncbi:TlpA family protein disulfide reductase [Marinobacterium jannaschii]|uniref:TlpA family protein disulfide reductase n=1 Tax=Marinobacterium jannaschii TaxID=64970 RepID=UPI0004859A79|nr:TlpA disulfide reductase family protein [Marinobacterium jannaschii]